MKLAALKTLEELLVDAKKNRSAEDPQEKDEAWGGFTKGIESSIHRIEMSKDNIPEAMGILKKALVEDQGYAWSWHCNIAMACADAIHADKTEALTWEDAHRIGNVAANSFMQTCFDVDTKEPK